MSGKIDAVDRDCEFHADLDNEPFRAWDEPIRSGRRTRLESRIQRINAVPRWRLQEEIKTLGLTGAFRVLPLIGAVSDFKAGKNYRFPLMKKALSTTRNFRESSHGLAWYQLLLVYHIRYRYNNRLMHNDGCKRCRAIEPLSTDG